MAKKKSVKPRSASKATTGTKPKATARAVSKPAKRTVAAKRSKKEAAVESNGEFTLESLLQAKELADRMGGIDKAREALSALEQLNG